MMPICQFCQTEKHIVTLKGAGGMTASVCQECLLSKNLDEVWQSQLDARMRRVFKEELAKIQKSAYLTPDERS